MDAPNRTFQGQDTTAGGRLYVAFELSEKSWKLSLGDGARAPSRCTVATGDTTAVGGTVLRQILKLLALDTERGMRLP